MESWSVSDVCAVYVLSMIRSVSFCCSSATNVTTVRRGVCTNRRGRTGAVWHCWWCSSAQATGMQKKRAEGELSSTSTGTIETRTQQWFMRSGYGRVFLRHTGKHRRQDTCSSLQLLFLCGRVHSLHFLFIFSSFSALYWWCVHGSTYETEHMLKVTEREREK